MTEEQKFKVKELLEKYNDILLVSMRLAVSEDLVNLIIQNKDDEDFSLSNLMENKKMLSDFIMREFLKQNSSSVIGELSKMEEKKLTIQKQVKMKFDK